MERVATMTVSHNRRRDRPRNQRRNSGKTSHSHPGRIHPLPHPSLVAAGLIFAALFAFFCLPAFDNRALAAPLDSGQMDSAKTDSAKMDSATKPSAIPPPPLDAHFKGKLPISDLTEDEAILHALDRLGYGPQPGEVDRIKQMGLEQWIDGQLHPEKIDDSGLEARLANLPATNMSATALLAGYPQPDAAAKKLGITVVEYRKRIDDLAHPPQGVHPAPSKLPQEMLNELQQEKVLRAIYSQRQLEQQLSDFWFNHFNVFAQKDLDLWLLPPYEHDAIRPHAMGKFRDLLEATAKSPAMLFYLDNYLSADPRAFAPKRPAQAAKHRPAPPHNASNKPAHPQPPIGGKRGLNENYGRELMELHTLGVDGGYTQQDVIEVARCFTGWTITEPRVNPQFYFDDRIHDPDPKRVMGKTIHAGGIKDGEQVLDLLTKNPRTAHHISLQLAQHFVSDAPPESLVARMAKAFQKSHGDVRETMRAMIYSPEFWSRAAYRAKVKTPFELVVSTTRALGADVDDAGPLVGWVGRIGEPLYQYLQPTGYSDKADAWVNTGALLNRLNFAITLASNRVAGSGVQLQPLLGTDSADDPYQALDRAVGVFLAGQISDNTRATLEKESTDPQVSGARLAAPVRQANLGVITGLVLGTPEFQQK
jgi:uncharacterized protein (DUF1800 family)